jgi:hypothetical protein
MLKRTAVSGIANPALPAGDGFAPTSKNRQAAQRSAGLIEIAVARGKIDD